jgi:hypothetical protein
VNLCEAKIFIQRTKNSFWRRMANFPLAAPLKCALTLPRAGAAALAWRKPRGRLPISRELTGRLSTLKFRRSRVRVRD